MSFYNRVGGCFSTYYFEAVHFKFSKASLKIQKTSDMYYNELMPGNRKETTLKNLSKEKLQKYIDDGITLAKIGRLYNSSGSAVLKKVKRDGLNYKTRKHMNLVASSTQKILDQYKLNKFPVDIKKLCQLMGFEVVISKDFKDDLSGMLNGTTIYVNGNHAETRQRFTMAHELGHAILHSKSIHEFKGFRSKMLNEDDDQVRRENEANSFAASLLMPLPILKEKLRQYDDIVTEAVVDDLKKFFNVSSMALVLRLRFLGYSF